AEPIADWTIAALAYFARGLDRMRAFQVAEHWASAELTALPVPFREFAELRLGVFGLGGIGGAIVRRGLALGMSVAGVRRRPERGGPPGVRWVLGLDALPRLAARRAPIELAALHARHRQHQLHEGKTRRARHDAATTSAGRDRHR